MVQVYSLAQFLIRKETVGKTFISYFLRFCGYTFYFGQSTSHYFFVLLNSYFLSELKLLDSSKNINIVSLISKNSL